MGATLFAIDPDNINHLKKLASLAQRVKLDDMYGSRVLRTSFWKFQNEGRAVSLVASVDKKIVAHIGLKRDPKFSNHIQVSWDMFDPEYFSSYAEVTSKFQCMLEEYLSRANMNVVYGFFDVERESPPFAVDVLELYPTAILPFAHKVGNERLSPQLCIRDMSHVRSEKKIFLPSSHKAIVRDMFLQHQVTSCSTADQGSIEDKALSWEAHQSHRHDRVTLYLSQAESSDTAPLRKYLRSLNRSHVFLVIDLCMAHNESIFKLLDQEEFHWCGILPHLRNTHSVVFYRSFGQDLIDCNGYLQGSEIILKYLNWQREDQARDQKINQEHENTAFNDSHYLETS